MNLFPTLQQITAKDKLDTFSKMYFSCSGLPIPKEYMTNEKNRVFAIYWRKKIIGGFILGRDTNFRTIQFFAKQEKQQSVISKLEELEKYTEITCFWIGRKNRTNTFLNIFVWLSMTYALRMYGTEYFLFGTCSRSLARLYAQTPKSIQIHRDRINKKATFIFKAHRSTCVTGMLEIISHKVKRIIKTSAPQKAFPRLLNFVKAIVQSNAVSHSPN
ncbi:MAG: hypothetical protein AAGA77_20895 [Bacteroidota bacterium]